MVRSGAMASEKRLDDGIIDTWMRALVRFGVRMIEKIKDLYHQYIAQILQWYDGLELLYQYGVLFLMIVIGLLFMSFIILSRITK
jgi:hypothetical protein